MSRNQKLRKINRLKKQIAVENAQGNHGDEMVDLVVECTRLIREIVCEANPRRSIICERHIT